LRRRLRLRRPGEANAVIGDVFSVSQVNAMVAEVISSEPDLADIWVAGEISNFTHHSSGHMYFSLKDEAARLKAVMFRRANQSLEFQPASGMKVIAHGEINVYPAGGDYQLYVDAMEPLGIGALFLRFQQLKAALEAEGLFDAALKRPIPRFPRRIGVITSPTGAAVHDIITVSKRRWPGQRILIIPAQVQGDSAPASIVRAIQAANSVALDPPLDVLIVGRGGGSMEDLWAFNHETVARAIRASRIPVISAVGHETDFTIADFAADIRAATPSAAAELAVPDMSAAGAQLAAAAGRMAASVRRIADRRRQRLDEAVKWMRSGMQNKLSASRRRLEHASAVLTALDPQAVLGRGYAICRHKDGRILRNAADAASGDTVRVTLGRGELGCEVNEVIL
jgi:exodeoxyribonuclease VII large subunit